MNVPSGFLAASDEGLPGSGGAGASTGRFDWEAGPILQAAREAIVVVDEAQRIVMLNPAAERMFMCTPAQALGKDLSDLIPQRHRAAHAAHVRAFDRSGLAERSMGARGEVVGLRSNGEEFPAEATISRIDGAGEFGSRRYFTALLRDLSTEKSLRATNEALNQRMRSIFDLAPIAIWITDGDEIVFANRACAALFGAQGRDALIGRSIYSLLAPDSHPDVRAKVVEAGRNEAPPALASGRIARLDGTVREVELIVAGLPDHGQTAVQMVIRDVTEHLRERQALARSRGELRRLSARLTDAREEERRRIARELHDELGQRLTALKMELSGLGQRAQDATVHASIASMLEMVDDTVASVRRIATDLRPLMLDDLGLNAAIEWLATGWARRMGIAVKLRLGADDPPVNGATAIALYRMVQEALTNVARHASATETRIELRQIADELLLVVQDNGVGFADAAAYREDSHGMLGMRERAYMLGGRLETGNAPGGGARIVVRLPIVPATAQATTDTGATDGTNMVAAAPAPAAEP